MQTIKVLLVDDDPIALEENAKIFSSFPNVEVVGAVDTGLAMNQFLQTHAVDLVTLDIEMKQESGFSLAEYLHRAFPDVLYLFLTGYVDFALKGYQYQPVTFLTKPISFVQVEQALRIVSERLDARDNTMRKKHQVIGIHTKSGMEIVNVDEVLYIEKKGRRCELVCRDGRRVSTAETIQQLDKEFSEYGFFQSHQSFLVQLDEVCSVTQGKFANGYVLKLRSCQEEIPLSRKRYPVLQELLSRTGLHNLNV